MISKLDEHLVQKGRSNVLLNDLPIVFKWGGAQNDLWDDPTNAKIEADSDVLDQLMAYAERHFFSQHRTGLFMLFVNGHVFRIIRWDRSGCIVTEALNYVETPEHTKKHLHFPYAYSKANAEQRGIDTTATRLSKDSCGW